MPTDPVPKIQITFTALCNIIFHRFDSSPTPPPFSIHVEKGHIYIWTFLGFLFSIFPYQGQWHGDNGQKTNLSFATGFQKISCATSPCYCIFSFNPFLPNLENVNVNKSGLQCPWSKILHLDIKVSKNRSNWKPILKSVWEGYILNMMHLHVWIFIETKRINLGISGRLVCIHAWP